ncbi:EB1-like protein, putative (macronuclear) [Tetrahymena thermophila SB210]|uniref:EB1-like protein, putative n=1 Tax=Tetrahymena thermophila (strain SB210) TaxID=312017 RepID=I7MH50_TETTS|nr:EB1-like protein, putative [Tetrahymena thermophila SB210]EAS02627.2 EB1-like protein, putative [Tetrahymena thermophila SB210]|eukprot:XP_001022872.2 EB1-like protein, putative [Tetrahymena thermophila SB210]
MASVENLSRGEMVQWINEVLKLNITKIECFGTGAIACQLIDCIHNNKVQLSKVNWKAKLEYEFVNNFKVLQQSFTKIGINKPIDVEKLTKCKYQDNLEFAQWIKKYFDQNGGAKQLQEYDPVGKRGNIEVDFSFIEGKSNAGASTTTTINSKDSNIQGNKVNQNRKQVAPRQATSIMISNEISNDLNKSQTLYEQKEQKEQNNFNYNIRGQNQIYESIIVNQRKSSNSSNSSAQSKPFNKNMIKNVQSSYEINSVYNNSNFLLPITNNNYNNNNNNNINNNNNNIVVSSYSDSNAINQKLQEEREFYFSKLKNIDHLLELYEELNLGDEVDELVFKIKDILYSTPQEQVQIQPDSNVLITQKQEQKENHDRKIFISEYVDQVEEDNN